MPLFRPTRPEPRDLILWGAGHAHVDALRRLARRRDAALRVTLLAREPHTPHAGMLPGLIRGDYGFDEAHVDLAPLAAAAGARLIVAEATGLDLVNRCLTFADRPPLPFGLLSINIGGEPQTPDDAAIPVKPVGRLLARLAEVEPHLYPGARLAIVGAGAGGVELALALAHRLAGEVTVALVASDTLPLPDAPPKARALARDALVDAGVEIVSNVQAGAFHEGRLALSDGSYLDAAAVLWATGVVASPILAAAGLACDPSGAIRVDRGLRSLSHPFVFAAGDCATMDGAPRPKAAIWSMRAGPVLARNLPRAARGLDPRPWRPHATAHVILGTGRGGAIAWRNGTTLAGARPWRWKDKLDRRWIDRFRAQALGDTAHKADTLAQPAILPVPADIITRLPRPTGGAGADVISAIAQPPPGFAVMQHVAHLPSCIDDPLAHGQIAAAHALSGLALAGAHPWTATLLLTPGQLAAADVTALLHGAQRVLSAAGCAVTDLRPVAGTEPALGLALTGLVAPDMPVWAGGARDGDALILTKPLGGALVLRAARAGRAKGRWRQAALASMARTNAAAIPVLRAHGASAGTDVMEPGLGASAAAMLTGTGLTTQLVPDHLPVLPGVRELLAGAFPDAELLALPEISGGILAAVPAMLAESCRDELRRAGYASAAIVGHVGAAGLMPMRPFAEPDGSEPVSYSRPAREPELLAVP